MALQLLSITKAGIGLGAAIRDGSAIMWNRTGATLVVGSCVMVDVLAADGGFGGNATAAAYKAVTNLGSDGHPLNNLLLPTTTGIGIVSGSGYETGQPMGIVVDLMGGAGADDTQVFVKFQGTCMANIDVDIAATNYGVLLVPKNADQDLIVKSTTAAVRAIARLLQDSVTVATQKQALVLLDGLNGMGSSFAS